MKKALFLIGMIIAFSTAGADEVSALAWNEITIRMGIAMLCVVVSTLIPNRKGNH